MITFLTIFVFTCDCHGKQRTFVIHSGSKANEWMFLPVKFKTGVTNSMANKVICVIDLSPVT